MIATTVKIGNEVLRLRDKDGILEWIGWRKRMIDGYQSPIDSIGASTGDKVVFKNASASEGDLKERL